MSKYTFPERKNTVNKKGVSLIVVTSPIPSHPDTTLIDEAIESVLKMNYSFSEMIISYDKDRKNTSSYKTYKKRMKSKYPQFKHLELDNHGHFIGTFHNALNHCKTKYFFLLQHDISLIGKFPIQECLNTKLPWNIIATHHFKPEECKNDIPEATHWFPIMKKTRDKNLLKSYGWSERIFLSKRDWMMDKIHEYYHKGKTVDFIESIFHKEFDKLWKRIQKITHFYDISTEPQYMKFYDKFWSEWKVYNLKSSVAYHKHLHGRTAKRKATRGKPKATRGKPKATRGKPKATRGKPKATKGKRGKLKRSKRINKRKTKKPTKAGMRNNNKIRIRFNVDRPGLYNLFLEDTLEKINLNPIEIYEDGINLEEIVLDNGIDKSELIKYLQTDTPSWENPIYYGDIRMLYVELTDPFENPEILDR